MKVVELSTYEHTNKRRPKLIQRNKSAGWRGEGRWLFIAYEDDGFERIVNLAGRPASSKWPANKFWVPKKIVKGYTAASHSVLDLYRVDCMSCCELKQNRYPPFFTTLVHPNEEVQPLLRRNIYMRRFWQSSFVHSSPSEQHWELIREGIVSPRVWVFNYRDTEIVKT